MRCLEFDLRLVPNNLQPLAWLIGIWRSEHGGKALFPTIPKFTYGEEIQFSLSDPHMNASKALNYTLVVMGSAALIVLFSAFAWSVNDNEELHSENGYLTIRDGSKQAALTTVMNNGSHSLRHALNFLLSRSHDCCRLRDRGRRTCRRLADKTASCGHRTYQLQPRSAGARCESITAMLSRNCSKIVFRDNLFCNTLNFQMVREWSLINSNTLQSKLDMETLTHGMREHTSITYTKIFP